MSTYSSACQCCNVLTELALFLFTTPNSPISFTAIRERQVDFLKNFLMTWRVNDYTCNFSQLTAIPDNSAQTLDVTSLHC